MEYFIKALSCSATFSYELAGPEVEQGNTSVEDEHFEMGFN